MKTRAFLLLCGLCLAVSGISAQLDAGLTFTPRFTRLLRQDLSTVAKYLLPASEPELCTAGQVCCQADSYASPYQLKYLNSSQVVIGSRTYTTFFYNFNSASSCRSDLDNVGCCSASANTIWVDVDPTLKVRYVALDGNPVASSEQSNYGLKIAVPNKAASQVPAAGIPLTVTVEGAADMLCPPPGLAPVPGLCELVVEGLPTSAGRGTCCPLSITRNSIDTFIPPADAFKCNADVGSNAFELVFDSASVPVPADSGTQQVTYKFRVAATERCDSSGVSQCCQAQLDYVSLRVTNLPITAMKLDGKLTGFNISTWNEPNSASYRSLLIGNLNWLAADLTNGGVLLEIIVSAPAGTAASDMDLCDASSSTQLGVCTYVMSSTDGLCCPSGPVVSADVPPVPPGTCNPRRSVPIADTSMSLQYYERASTASSTTFTFMVADFNGPKCTKTYCADVCSWSLYLDSALAPRVAVGHEDPAKAGQHALLAASKAYPASLTFKYGPSGESTTSFFLTLPYMAADLSALCARNALPGQGNFECAAIVRSGTVYATVFFNAKPLIDTLPALPTPCPSAKPLASSCMGVPSARFNAQKDSTVVDFGLALSSGSCLRPSPAGQNVGVRLFLAPAAIDQLTVSNAVQPAGVLLDHMNGASWSLSQKSQHLKFQLGGSMAMADVCRQGLLADQPAGSCVVEVTGVNGCFRGYITASPDRIGMENPSSGVDKAVVVPATVIPVVLLLAALVLGAMYYRRRRGASYAAVGGSGLSQESLQRPLAGGDTAADDLSVQSAAPSDVHIRVSGASQGGAPRH